MCSKFNGLGFKEYHIWWSKNKFDNKILKSVNNIVPQKPSNNRTKLLKIFFDLGETFTGRFYDLKILDEKYEATELKNKGANKQSKLET